MQRRPILQIIAGPNGAGKSTFARTFLKNEGVIEFLNADLLAAALSPFDPNLYAIRAGRLLLQRWDELAFLRKSFSIESTLSGVTYVSRIKSLLKKGYEIRIIYLWLPSVEIALKRVRQRVMKGGHHVPDVDVRRRFVLSLNNFNERYLPLANEALIYDASTEPPSLIVSYKEQKISIQNPKIYDRIKKQ